MTERNKNKNLNNVHKVICNKNSKKIKKINFLNFKRRGKSEKFMAHRVIEGI